MARRPNSSARLKRLLEAGYFPEELPPPFVTHPFARFRAALERAWPADLSKYEAIPEPYSVPRHSHARRRVVICNPISQFRVSKVVADNWIEIKAHLSKSNTTEFRPIFDMSGDRSLFGINWRGVDAARVRIAAQYGNQFHTDISKFYPSIYTHAFAWAYFGKARVQANLKAGWLTTSFIHQLDKVVRHGQRNQSVGIPIGPDTSRIIAEIVAVGIEERLKGEIKNYDQRAVRYVDDFTIGIDENESEEFIAAALERALSHFELDVNFDKTKVVGHRTPADSRWIYDLIAYNVFGSGPLQRDYIDRYFGAAVAHSDRADQDAVLKWAIKRSRSFRIEDGNFQYYIETVLRVSRRAPACLRALAQLLIDARFVGRPLPMDSIRKFVVDHVRIHAPSGHAFEVSWALFICKGLNMSLKRSEVSGVFSMRSSVCALLLMDLNARGLIDGGIDDRLWKRECASASGLQSDMWLLSYEAVKKGWWTGAPTAYVSTDPFFGPLLARGVYFYSEERNFRTTRAEARRNLRHLRVASAVLLRWADYF